MARLSMPINRVEDSENKITPTTVSDLGEGSFSAFTSSTGYYPNMQTAIDIAHPIGSIICMSSNTNPSTLYGGTWTLVDKELSYRFHNLYKSGWSATNATAQTSAGAVIGGHAMDIRLEVTTTTALSDSTIELGYINPNALGITEFPIVYRYVPFSYDGGGVFDVVGQTVITDVGRITVEDIWTATANGASHAYASGAPLHMIYHFSSIPFNYMLDSYCDKFYFKRTA